LTQKTVSGAVNHRCGLVVAPALQAYYTELISSVCGDLTVRNVNTACTSLDRRVFLRVNMTTVSMSRAPVV